MSLETDNTNTMNSEMQEVQFPQSVLLIFEKKEKYDRKKLLELKGSFFCYLEL